MSVVPPPARHGRPAGQLSSTRAAVVPTATTRRPSRSARSNASAAAASTSYRSLCMT